MNDKVTAVYGEQSHGWRGEVRFWSAKPEKPGLKDHLKGVEAKNAELRKQLEDERAEVGRLQDDLYKAETVREALQSQLMVLRSLDQRRDFCQAQLRDERDALQGEVERLQGKLRTAEFDNEHLTSNRDFWRGQSSMFSSEVECLKVELRGANLDIADKRRVIDELRVKLSQVTAKADADVKAVAEFRAAWEKLQGMFV